MGDNEKIATGIIEGIWSRWYGKYHGDVDSDIMAGILADAKAKIIRALDSPVQGFGCGWQPMDTAPKDGSEILLATTLRWGKLSLDKDRPRIGTGFYVAGAYWWDEKPHVWRNRLGQFMSTPTHWMPVSGVEGG